MKGAEASSRLPRLLATIFALLLAAYVCAAAYLYLAQRSYVFVPGGALQSPAELGLPGVSTVALKSKDGTALTGWFAPPRPGQPTVLYFHGNAGNLSGRAERFTEVLGSGFGLLAMSYRGYPGSGGSPSEGALFSDALVAFDWLAERTPEIVMHGESLGTGVATYVAAERQARALILEAPYTAALDMAAEAYPWIPVSWLMRDPFLTREHIGRVDEPVLIVHGTADRVIPVQHGRRLFEAAGDPKALQIVDRGSHSDLWDRGLWAAVLDFLQKHPGAASPQAAVRRIPSLAAS